MDDDKLNSYLQEYEIIDNSWPQIFSSYEHSEMLKKLEDAQQDFTPELSHPEKGVAETKADKEESTSLPDVPDAEQNGLAVFFSVIYLGCTMTNAGRSEKEIQRNMSILHEQITSNPLKITLSIPTTREGSVILYENNSCNEIAAFPLSRVLLCARGYLKQSLCLAFNCSHGDYQDSVILQCHAFKALSLEVVVEMLTCFSRVFSKSVALVSSEPKPYSFEANVEIMEEDSKSAWNTCPHEKHLYKLRSGLKKLIIFKIKNESSTNSLPFTKVLDLVLKPGQLTSEDTFRSLEDIKVEFNNSNSSVNIQGLWNPIHPAYDVLNMVTPAGSVVHLTVAAKFQVEDEVVQLPLELKVKLFPTTTNFWDSAKRVIQFNRQPTLVGPPCSPLKGLEDLINDEPLLSGTGIVTKHCSDLELDQWAQVLVQWRNNLDVRPKKVTQLIHQCGIPEMLRGEVWQLLVHQPDNQLFIDNYRTLIPMVSKKHAAIIKHDINRTFPAHTFFKDSNGKGQESLFKICKAYSSYDIEVSYCQGLSYLAAALLLHMPEEQAFTVLVRIMYTCQLRDLFKNSFDQLHIKLFLLDSLIEDQLPDLALHFQQLGIESHMFASQWFLTLFTAKFPLQVVFYTLDLFLLEGMECIFQVALALLTISRKDLLQLDFEGVLKYFRVNLPRKYNHSEMAMFLLHSATNIKLKKLKKFEKKYLEEKLKQGDSEEALKEQNTKLYTRQMVLEFEMDSLIQDILTSTDVLKEQLNVVEKENQEIKDLVLNAKEGLRLTNEENIRLATEISQLKARWRTEIDRSSAEQENNSKIIVEYQKIQDQMSKRLKDQQKTNIEEMTKLKAKVCLLCGNESVKPPPSDEVPPNQERLQTLESELAEAKVMLAVYQARNQSLEFDIMKDSKPSKNWISKTLVSFLEKKNP